MGKKNRKNPLARLLDSDRASLVNESRDLYLDIWPDTRPTHACLFHACALQALIFLRTGELTLFQAGGCSWPMIDPKTDDGVQATHFSYVWEDSPTTRLHLAMGQLPELHVWLAYRNPDTIIDPTTGTWPDRARVAGYTWSAINPPEYMWATRREMKLLSDERGLLVGYDADLAACKVANMIAGAEIYPKIAKAVGLDLGGVPR